MLDSNLLFSDAAVTTSTGNSSVVTINRTPGDGVWVKLAVTAVSGTSPTLDVTTYEGPVAFGSSNLVHTLKQITAVGDYYFHIQSGDPALRHTYTLGGTTPSFTITSGIVPAPRRDTAVTADG